MSLLDEARVTVLLADYIAADGSGKLTAVGAGFTLAGLQPDGTTAPMHVAVLVDVPASHVGQDFALGIGLVDEATGESVVVPGQDGRPEAMRVAQVVQAQAPSVPGMVVPAGAPGRVQLVLGFPQGLPLPSGRSYRWAVELDGRTRPEWSTSFHVPSPTPGPVFGGPTGPTSIPPL